MSDINNNELYKCSSKLEKKGYEYDEKGIYCPITNKIFLKITREETEYAFVLVEKEGSTSKYISPTYKNKKSITESSDSLKNKIKSFLKNNELDIDAESKLMDIAVDLMNEENFTQITETFEVYGDEKAKSEIDNDNEVDEKIAERKKPKLKSFEKKKAKQIEEKIKEMGFVGYLKCHLDKIHKGDHRNIFRKTMGAYNIIIGNASFLIETIADSEEGKSLEDWIVFNLIIPQQYIYKVNSITESSFTRYGEKSEYYFDRMILLFGDLGRKNAFKSMEELFNILKVLITEKEYVRDLSDKSNIGNYSNKHLKLKCDSIGGVYSSTKNNFTEGDSQLESRTISCTPNGADDDEVLDFLIDLECEISPETKEKEEAVLELKKFRNYILYCATKDLTIINPYGQVFKRYALKSDTPKRELKQTMKLFEAYCRLTYFNCKNIKGYYVATEEQLNEFMTDISLENALIPYESDFLKMLMGKESDNTLVLIDEEKENEDKHLDTYYQKILELMFEEDEDFNPNSFADLNDYQQKKAVNQLLKLYRLGGTSIDHEENVFFRIRDITRIYSRYKSFKNIDNIQTLIHILVSKGYMDSLEYKDGKQKIYYLTGQCEDIITQIELTDEDKEAAEEYLKKLGLSN